MLRDTLIFQNASAGIGTAIRQAAFQAPSWQMRVRDLVPRIVDAITDDHRRIARAQVRILRVAMEYKRTGTFLDLEDPLGSRLLHSESEGRTRIWSAKADWSTNPPDENRAFRKRVNLEMPP